MNNRTEFKLIVKCSQYLRFCVYVHEFAHLKLVNILYLDNCVRLILLTSRAKKRFEARQGSVQ